MESLYQGGKDVFLVGVRADFNAVEDQAVKAVSSLEKNGLLNSDVNTDGLFTNVSNVTTDGNIAVWRNTSVAGLQQMGQRIAGGNYPTGTFPRGWETVVTDPNLQDAVEIAVPEERQDAESAMYKSALNRAQKIVIDARRKNIGDPFDLLNQAFVAPSSFTSPRFFGKGNQGVDGNLTALNEALIIGQNAGVSNGHKLANAPTVNSTTAVNGVSNSGNWAAFGDTYYYAALEQATTFIDDVGKPMPMFGGSITIVVPNANSLVRTAKEINKSEWKVGTANNEVNVLNGTLTRVISSPYLTNSINYVTANAQKNKWYLIDTATQDPQVGTGLLRVCFVPTNSRVERRQENDAIVYKLKQSYCYVNTDWRNVIGSLGTGAIS
jgi:hypothetical protein